MKLWESRKKNQEGEELKELFQKETLQEEESSEEPFSDNGTSKKENPVLRFLSSPPRSLFLFCRPRSFNGRGFLLPSVHKPLLNADDQT